MTKEVLDVAEILQRKSNFELKDGGNPILIDYLSQISALICASLGEDQILVHSMLAEKTKKEVTYEAAKDTGKNYHMGLLIDMIEKFRKTEMTKPEVQCLGIFFDMMSDMIADNNPNWIKMCHIFVCGFVEPDKPITADGFSGSSLFATLFGEDTTKTPTMRELSDVVIRFLEL